VKNRPVSWCLIALSLALWIDQVLLQFRAPDEIPPPHLVAVQTAWTFVTPALCQLWPYAIICAVITFVPLELFGKWLLCFAVIVVGVTGIAAWVDFNKVGGGCMTGLVLLGGFGFQCFIAICSVSAALLAKVMGTFFRKAALTT
jgi:hypothetical protein